MNNKITDREFIISQVRKQTAARAMPSKYRRKPGSRRYVDYTKEQLEQCVVAVKSKILTQRAASEQYGIPRSTIKNKLAQKYGCKPGRPTVFSEQEEASFVSHLTALSEYGFPLTEFDLKMIIREYLASQGRIVAQFKNNIPGKDWMICFLKRHQHLSRRLANNIKRVRAQVSENIIADFIQNIGKETEEVPPENIYNYDETNLCDDPGRKTVICRRGTKYPETIINATKVSFTVMFCGNAAGETVPPFIIYKSEHLWSTWTEDGPEGARYNRTKSGWIDAATFEDWFLSHLLPILRKKNGRKVVIGDNLSSHINERVLLECEKHNISFICLPPNATHILQPLDVAYFRPLKCKWRQILLDWKSSQTGRKLPTTPKEQFPCLLKKALNALTESKENLIAGFKKTGIFPVNKEEPLSRLPRQDRIMNIELITNSFIQKLEQSRIETCQEKKIVKKRKLNVPPGKSISASDVVEAAPSNLRQIKVVKRKKVMRKRSQHTISSSTSCSDSEISLASSTEDHIISDDEDIPLAMLVEHTSLGNVPQFKHAQTGEERRNSHSTLHFDDIMLTEHVSNVEEDQHLVAFEKVSETQCASSFEDSRDSTTLEQRTQSQIEVVRIIRNKPDTPVVQDDALTNTCSYINTVTGDHVLVTWGSQKYPGQVVSTSEEAVLVNCMKKGKMFWRWPMIRDEQLYSWDQLVCKIGVPKFVKKGCFSVPEMD